jgi:ActR/RegA family two-component response regulator
MDPERRAVLYLDEDVSTKLARELRHRGYRVVTTQEAGQRQADDDSQLAYAAVHDLALVTYNQGDFCLRHRNYLSQGHSHAGIVIASRKVGFGETLRRLVRLLETVSARELCNQIRWLSEFAGE